MKTITMTSPDLPGEVHFTYNGDNMLTVLEMTESLAPEQYHYLLHYTPWHLDQFEAFAKRCKNATFVDKALEVTFTMFWNRYNDKVRSSKKKTEDQWKKMSITEQVKAYHYIPRYERTRGSAEKKYATTYLSDQLWNN